MRPENKILSIYSEPKYVVQVGDYHGVILIDYTPDKKYETYIDLTLMNEDEYFISFFAKMSFNESYTNAESKFGFFDESLVKVKQHLRNIPFYKVVETLHSFMPIRTEVFIDLVKQTLTETYQITDEFCYWQVQDKDIEKYYAQDESEERLISYQAINDYFYVSKSVFNCITQTSDRLVIDDYNFNEFPMILLNCSWLRELELSELLVANIPEEITRLQNLISLSLKLKFLDKLPSSLPRLTKLEILKLERTSLTELPKKLFELHNLKELHIINNRGIKALSNQISQLNNLEYLYAYANEIKAIPNEIFKLEKLKILNLAHNKIEQLPKELTALPNLRVLNLKGNRLQNIPDDLFKMQNLEEVDFSNNPALNPDEIFNLLMKSGRCDKINLVL